MKRSIDKKRGLRIRLARMRAGLTQAQLARLLGCGQQQVSRMELGHDFPWSLAKRVTHILRISYAYLNGEEDLGVK